MKFPFSTVSFYEHSLKIIFYKIKTFDEKQTKLFDIENKNKYHIFYCLQDGIFCSLKDKHHHFKKGDIIILRPNENIKFYVNSALNYVDSDYIINKTSMHLLRIEINDKLFENDIDLKGFFRVFNEREKYKYNIYTDSEFYPENFFHNCTLQLAKYVSNNSDPYIFKSIVSTMIAQLNYHFDKSHNYSPAKYSREYEVKIYDYICRNFNKNITIELLSNEFFISKTYINKVTNRFYGTNFNEMILSLRMWEAIDLMKNKVDLTKISSLCGYKNYSSFYRNFLKFFGVKPTEREKEIHELVNKKEYIKLKEITNNKKTDSI